jgi:hypothetical protein
MWNFLQEVLSEAGCLPLPKSRVSVCFLSLAVDEGMAGM